MSLYIFACEGENGVPDADLILLLRGRIKYEKVFFSPENAYAGARIADEIGITYEECALLSLKKQTETDREYLMRIKKEGARIASPNSNNILFLPPENVRVLCRLKETPPHGYSEVI